MKKIFFFIVFCGLALIVKAQNSTVERSTFGIQTGLAGIWVHNEAKLSNKIALRSELGIGVGYARDFLNGSGNNRLDLNLHLRIGFRFKSKEVSKE